MFNGEILEHVYSTQNLRTSTQCISIKLGRNMSAENSGQNGTIEGNSQGGATSGPVPATQNAPGSVGPGGDGQGEAGGVTVRGQVFCCSPRYTGLQYIGEGAYGMVV